MKAAVVVVLGFCVFSVRRLHRLCIQCAPFKVRERGSAPRRGRHSTMFVSTKCMCAVATQRFDNPHRTVVPRSRIPRSTSHFSYNIIVSLMYISSLPNEANYVHTCLS